MFAPIISGADDDAVRKYSFAGGCKKAVYILFLQPVVFCVQLALDSVVFVSACCLRDFCDKVNARIVRVYTLFPRPVGIEPYVAIQVFV